MKFKLSRYYARSRVSWQRIAGSIPPGVFPCISPLKHQIQPFGFWARWFLKRKITSAEQSRRAKFRFGTPRSGHPGFLISYLRHVLVMLVSHGFPTGSISASNHFLKQCCCCTSKEPLIYLYTRLKAPRPWGVLIGPQLAMASSYMGSSLRRQDVDDQSPWNMCQIVARVFAASVMQGWFFCGDGIRRTQIPDGRTHVSSLSVRELDGVGASYPQA